MYRYSQASHLFYAKVVCACVWAPPTTYNYFLLGLDLCQGSPTVGTYPTSRARSHTSLIRSFPSWPRILRRVVTATRSGRETETGRAWGAGSGINFWKREVWERPSSFLCTHDTALSTFIWHYVTVTKYGECNKPAARGVTSCAHHVNIVTFIRLLACDCLVTVMWLSSLILLMTFAVGSGSPLHNDLVTCAIIVAFLLIALGFVMYRMRSCDRLVTVMWFSTHLCSVAVLCLSCDFRHIFVVFDAMIWWLIIWSLPFFCWLP